ncbi:MAG: alpha/beta hydrolase [Actinomycetota bacterium]
MADEIDLFGALRPHHESLVALEGGRSLGYAEYGDPEGDPVLWFHGTPGARKQIPPDVPGLSAERRIRMIGVERPGTGFSTAYTYERIIDWADDLKAFADGLGIDRFATVGLSGGGPYVLAACQAMPDRVSAGAVLGGIGPTRGRETAPGYTRILPLMYPLLAAARGPLSALFSNAVKAVRDVASPGYDLYRKFIAPPSDRAVLEDPAMKAVFLYDLTTALEGGLRAPVSDIVLFGRHWGFSLRDITVPVKFWHGDADKIVPLSHGEFMTPLVPGAELSVVPGGGHFAGYILGREVLDWIGDVWGDRKYGRAVGVVHSIAEHESHRP